MDRCPQCGSVHLVRRLGEVECRDCGTVVPPAAGHAPLELAPPAAGQGERAPGGRAPGLSEEVALALERVLGRNAARR
jgi:hypothetical protein